MPRKKKNSFSALPPQVISYAIAIVFLIVSGLTIFGDSSSVVGRYAETYLSMGFGKYYKFIFAPVLALIAIFLFRGNSYQFNTYRFFGLIFFYVSLVTLLGWKIENYSAILDLGDMLIPLIGTLPLVLGCLGLFFISLFILFRFSLISFVLTGFKNMPSLSELRKSVAKEAAYSQKAAPKKVKKWKENSGLKKQNDELEEKLEALRREKEQLAKMKQPSILKTEKSGKKIPVGNVKSSGGKISALFGGDSEKKDAKTQTKNENFSGWNFPGSDLLELRETKLRINERQIRTKEIEIQEKLLQFGIAVTMSGYKVGPTVIQYRLKPKEGVKLQKIVNLKDDLTLALHAKNIRIQAPIPGLGVVGIEVPNDERQAVGLRELIESVSFHSKKMEIPLAVGKDVSGNMIFGDLTKMPHLLVAGQTASGKSVGMNGFLISMLYKFSPSELKMIMIDPKRVELSVYNGIPHLLTPVITNPEKALNSLKWAVAEMLRRYDLATAVKARNLKEYNAKVSKDEKLPYIVIVIDELADLMMSGQKKEVEGNIARIAQMARAVGMHLIVATQRPSVDVITGLIKANIPSRIAFTVASQIDSRAVIDKMGAEDLLGRGDMLYYPTGNLEPERVQGVLVETHEIEAVVNQLKLTIDPEMLQNMQDPEIANGKSAKAGSVLEGYEGDQDEDPEIIEKAIAVVKESRKGSTSLIQRKLGLGYARAAKVLDILEDLGVVGPANGSKPREVYVD